MIEAAPTYSRMTDVLARLRTALQGQYRVDREVGSGGMATVYLAHDAKHGREVAIKVLLPDLAAAVGSDRFLREIKVTSTLQHPHILPLYDSGAVDGLVGLCVGSGGMRPAEGERRDQQGGQRQPAAASDVWCVGAHGCSSDVSVVVPAVAGILRDVAAQDQAK